MASWFVGQDEEASENFVSLLREESDLEEGSDLEEESDSEDDWKVEFSYLEEVVEPGELKDLGPDFENVDSPPEHIGKFTQEGEDVPFNVSSSPSCALLSPAIIGNPPRVIQPSSSPRDPLSSASAESPPRVVQPCDVVIIFEEDTLGTAHLKEDPGIGDDDINMDENTYHLADEHQVFKQVAERTQRPVRGCERGRPRSHGLNRGRRQETGGPQWEKGDRLIEVHVNDDDVPEELREMVMRVVNSREAVRVCTKANVRRQWMAEAEAYEEERMDADDGEDEALFAGGGASTRFEWSSMHDYSGKREPFLPQRTGPVVASKNAYEAFRQYWDDGILSHIVTETNRYAVGLASSSANFAREWYDTNVHEILILFSFWMMLGIIQMPSTKSCFTLNPLLQTNIFRKMFTRTRYENLCRALHFNDNSNRPTDDTDRLFSFGPILDHLKSRFMEAYIPSQNIYIDESLTLWNGRLSFRQYIKTKTVRFGVKTFELCESSTGYLWSFFLNVGAGTTYDSAFPSTLPKSTSTVLTLIHPLLDKGYTVFMDNWFNSPLLAKFLKRRKTDCVGTLRANCCNVPPLISQCKLKEGQFVARHSGDVVVLAYQDKKRMVSCISTYHGHSQDRMDPKPHREPQCKPQIILDYNKSMGGVDRKDQMLEPYLLEQKRCAKWNMKVFKRLLNCSILNSRILLQASTATSKDHLVFRLELVDQLLQHHFQHVPKQTTARPPSSTLPASRVVGNHWPRQIHAFINSGRRVRRRCVLCSQQRLQRRTTFVCSVCEVPLCVEPCFRLYHNKS